MPRSEYPLLTVKALRTKPELQEQATMALNNKLFPERLRGPLKSLLSKADTLSASFFCARAEALLEFGRDLHRKEKLKKQAAVEEHRMALERREALRKRLSENDLFAEDAEELKVMLEMFERHLKCRKKADPARSESDMVLQPRDFLGFTKRFLKTEQYVPVSPPVKA